MISQSKTSSPFDPVLKAIETRQRKIKLNGLTQSTQALFLSSVACSGSPFCLVASSTERARTLFEELSFFLEIDPRAARSSKTGPPDNHSKIKPLFYPPWDILPYEPSNPRPDWIAERLSTLYSLALNERVCIVTTIEAFLQRVVSKSLLLSTAETLRVAGSLPTAAVIAPVRNAGYQGAAYPIAPG